MNDTQSTHKKIIINNLSPDCEERRKLVANAQRFPTQSANEQRFANVLGAYSAQ